MICLIISQKKKEQSKIRNENLQCRKWMVMYQASHETWIRSSSSEAPVTCPTFWESRCRNVCHHQNITKGATAYKLGSSCVHFSICRLGHHLVLPGFSMDKPPSSEQNFSSPQGKVLPEWNVKGYVNTESIFYLYAMDAWVFVTQTNMGVSNSSAETCQKIYRSTVPTWWFHYTFLGGFLFKFLLFLK